MTRPHIDSADLSLIVRALHRDVSELDQRLRRLAAEIVELRHRAAVPDAVDLRMLGIGPRA